MKGPRENRLFTNTDAAIDRWFDYPLGGQQELTVSLARNVGASPIDVRICADLDLVWAAPIDSIIGVLYDVQARPPGLLPSIEGGDSSARIAADSRASAAALGADTDVAAGTGTGIGLSVDPVMLNP